MKGMRDGFGTTKDGRGDITRHISGMSRQMVQKMVRERSQETVSEMSQKLCWRYHERCFDISSREREIYAERHPEAVR
jgi:hypothetical protein